MKVLSDDYTASIDGTHLDYDAIVIGAGIGGLYQLYKLRELGMKVRVLETGTGVGGTWYWNRYPGARFDSESYSYAYSFSTELLNEWDWTEHFSPQPETLRYLQYVADKFDLLKDIQFSSKVESAIYDEDSRCWIVSLSDETTYKSRFLITAIGLLSDPTLPKIEGIDSFKGNSFHTSRWPKYPIDFSDKRVAVIGTGATGIQTIQELVKTVGHLTVFQRRPNWCTPLNNEQIKPDEMKTIKDNYSQIFERCKQTEAGFVHGIDSRGTFDVTETEREEFWEDLYAGKGFGIWQGNFKDVLVNPKANKLMSDFVAKKIRSRVNDPEIAEKLIPKDHGFGTRRVPMETNYYEAYNRENIVLIDINDNPIIEITENGIKTKNEDFAFDFIIFATGFDAITGAFDRIDIQGVEKTKLKKQWRSELGTFLGMQVSNFPNMFMIMGPHALLGNNPRSIEYNVEWITDLLKHMRDSNFSRVEATSESVNSWLDYVKEKGEGLLSNKVDSWMTGVNSNVEGKQKRIIARYSGTAQSYRNRCDEVSIKGYTELKLS
jgi:cation diffusion facilitator CzcD-associated flavoprotein CzcO